MNVTAKTLHDPRVEDTYAEAFAMKYTRLLVTALNRRWLQVAAQEFCGYGTSVIGCDVEAGIESWVSSAETPDGREGVSLLAFGFSTDGLAQAVVNRTGQCLMTCPTTAVFNGLAVEKTFPLGQHLRFFGDGFQKSKRLGQRRFWRVPVMDGEFLCEEKLGVAAGIGGGNFILQASHPEVALHAACRAVDAIAAIEGCVTPFPGGIARSGSKVGSRYRNQVASTAEGFCPTLRGRVDSQLHPQAVCAYEIVIDAVDESVIRQAMRRGIEAALAPPTGERLLRVSAGHYGGRLGTCLVSLRSL